VHLRCPLFMLPDMPDLEHKNTDTAAHRLRDTPENTDREQKLTSLPRTRSSVYRIRAGSLPLALIAAASASSLGHSRPWMCPPMHFKAAAAITPCARKHSKQTHHQQQKFGGV
jgi:fatty acid desaturase